MRILSLSDAPVTYIYSPIVRARYKDVDVIVGCGDLAYYYLEYVYNALDAPLFFVRGNHDKVIEYSSAGQRSGPHGGMDLHRCVVNYRGLLLAGIEGSPRYRSGPFQYSQGEMWAHVLWLAPRLMWNQLRYGRALDVFVTHAPPSGVHEGDDYPHRGIHAFRWLVKVFQPAVLLHGHVHLYSPMQPVETCLGSSRVINAYGAREVEISLRS
jgi:Icc-related predicted phosphoesterase